VFTTEERKQKIESYGRASETLREGLKKFPREMWDFKPTTGWSIHQILVHIADSEANSYVRCRRFIAEPGSGVYGYNTDAWADDLHYDQQSVEDNLALFDALRRCSYLLIRTLPDSTWANTVEHSESGTMNMDKWLDIYDRHVRDHLQQMQEVFDEWKKSNP
jgi:hypothetical protein